MNDLNAMRADHIKAARAILDTAKKEDRDLTPEEQETVQGEMTEVKNLDVQIKGRQLVKTVMDLGIGTDDLRGESETPGDASTLGDHFLKSVGADALIRLKAQSGYTVAAPEWSGPVKAAGDPHTTVGAGVAPYMVEYDTYIRRAFRPGPVVADLLGSGTMSGTSISYLIEGAVEGAFTTVAQGAAKPQIHQVNPTAFVDGLKKIAAFYDTTDEMLEDLPFMVSEINNRGLYLLQMFEEAQLVAGDGVGTNVLGLINRVGIQTEAQAAAPDTAADAIFRAMTEIQTATGLTADGIIINPVDYQALRLGKDANNQYYGGGYFSGQYGAGGIMQQPPLWGLRTVVSTATTAKSVIVGAFAQAATVYRKGGVRVESTNSDGVKFTTNIITTRIEERIALAVRVPLAIDVVTLL